MSGDKGDDDIDITKSGTNTVIGGAGKDNILYSDSNGTTGREISVEGGDGNDTIQSTNLL